MRVEIGEQSVQERVDCVAEQGIRSDVLVLRIDVGAAEGEDWAVEGDEGVEEEGGDLCGDGVVEKPKDVGSG